MSTQMLLWYRILGSLDRSSVNRQKEKIPPVLHIMHVPAKVWEALAEKVLICFKFFNSFNICTLRIFFLLMELFLIGVMVAYWIINQVVYVCNRKKDFMRVYNIRLQEHTAV